MQIPIFAYIATTSCVVPIGIGLLKIKSLGRASKLFLLYLIIVGVELVIEFVLGRMSINNLFVINWGNLIETSLIVLTFIAAADTSRTRTLYTSLLLIFIAFWLTIYVVGFEGNKINTSILIFSRLIIIITSVHYLHQNYLSFQTDLTKSPMYWIAAGNLLYSAGTIFVLGLANELMQYGIQYFTGAWYINWGLMLASNIIFAKGFSCSSRI